MKDAIELSGEPWRPLSRWIITDNPHVREHTIRTLWDAIIARQDYRARYAALWNATADDENGANGGMVDVILCPAGPGVAPKLDCARYWGYTAQWNLLDYPALVFPVGGDRVRVETDGGVPGYPPDYAPRNESDAYNWEQWRKHGAEGYKDAPISLQLVARRYGNSYVYWFLVPILDGKANLDETRFDDEKLLRAAEILLEEAGLPKTC